MRRVQLAVLTTGIVVSSFASARAAVPVSYTFQLQARANLLANPSGSFNVPHGSTFGSTTVSLNNLGEVASRLSTVGSTTDQGIFFGPGNGTGGVVAQQDDEAVGFLSDVNLGDTGRIVVSQSLSASGVPDGFYVRDRGQAFGLTYFTGASGLSASGYRVLPDNSVSSRTNLNNVVGYRRVAADGTTVQTYATQTTGGFSFLASAAPANDGRIAGRVFNDAQPAASNDQVRLFSADGSSTLILSEGQVLPGIGTVVSFGNGLSANASGFVAVQATINAGAGNRGAVLLSDGTTTRLIASVDSPLVSAVDAFAPAINAAGLVAFRGREEDGDDAIFIGDGLGNLLRVIGEADAIASDVGPAQLGQETASPPTFSGGIALNDLNQIAFTTGLYPVGNRAVEYGAAIYIANAVIPEPTTLGVAAAIGTLILRRRR